MAKPGRIAKADRDRPREPGRDTLISLAQIAELLGVCARTVQRLKDARKLPPHLKISRVVHRWRLGEIQDWIERQRSK